MFARRSKTDLEIATTRLILRPPQIRDFEPWSKLRRTSQAYLTPWEPAWSADHLTSRSFRNRVTWAERSIRQGDAYPLFLIRQADRTLVGGITLSNVRREPAQSGAFGYWVGQGFARQGYMTEALDALKDYAFSILGLSRLEAACLPDNAASRKLLERCGFKYEGVAQAYLQINGRWRNHVLYAALRADRRGRVEL